MDRQQDRAQHCRRSVRAVRALVAVWVALASPPARRQMAFIGLLAIALTGRANAQLPPLWDKLTPGPHAVGFKSLWQLDYSRRYNMTYDDMTVYASDKPPRPILVNIWYPAKSAGNVK